MLIKSSPLKYRTRLIMSNGSSFNVFLLKKYSNFLVLDLSSFTSYLWRNSDNKKKSKLHQNKQLLKFDKKYR